MRRSHWLCTGVLAALILTACSGGGGEGSNPPEPRTSIDIPRTGQTGTYASGDDGDLQMGAAWPVQRFIVGTNAEAGCITDMLTGLMWVKAPDATQRTWQEGMDFANGLSLCGHTDWRLPNRNELASLIHYGLASNTGWLSSAGFSNLTGGYYWSSTTSAANTASAFMVWTGSGEVNVDSKGAAGRYAWPVRDAAVMSTVALPRTGQTATYAAGDDGDLQKGFTWPDPRFTVNADTTVSDNLTGLDWAPDGNLMPARDSGWDTDGADDGNVTWQHALDYIAKLNAESYLGHNDWRLPNVNELRSMLNAGQSNNPAWLNTQGFGNIRSSFYWSSTTLASDVTKAWSVDMSAIYVWGYIKATDVFPLWPVRGGKGP